MRRPCGARLLALLLIITVIRCRQLALCGDQPCARQLRRRLLPYIVGTAIGMAPRTGIVSWVASAR